MNPASRSDPWLIRIGMILAAWFAAFILVMALFALTGDRLQSLPLALRVLIITGVMVISMTALVEPALSHERRRWTDS